MFCIAAFIILGILSIFSARYRRLAAEAWKCVARKTTFRKCDTSFKADMKSRLLGKLSVRRPRLAKLLDKWIEVLAFLFVLLTIWSLFMTVKSGLNLYVYDTCNPNAPESCSLGAEACSVDTIQPSLWQSVKTGHIASWAHRTVNQFGETLSQVPDRLKKWNPRQYTTSTSSYYYSFSTTKKTALEIVDPGCRFCAQLFRNMKAASVESRYNLTYIAYPIPDSRNANGYKFPHSYHIATYLEAIKEQPLAGAKVPADWQILERIFTWKDPATGVGYQTEINVIDNNQQVDNLLQKWLSAIGYSDGQVQSINRAAQSQKAKDNLASQRQIVEKKIKTVKIPTLLLDTRRYDGVVDTNQLKRQ